MRASDYFDQNRTYLRQFFSVYDQTNDHLVGHIMDISAGGMMMISNDPIEADKILKLRIELPEVIKAGGRLMLEARCVWCKKQENPACHYSGIKFISISEEQIGMIEKLIEMYTPVTTADTAPKSGGIND